MKSHSILSFLFPTLLLMAIPSCQDYPPPDLNKLEIVAHRGASYLAPENTLEAIDLAWEKNADAVEVDVHMTSDEQIVVIHDKTTERTTDRKYTIAETPYDTLAQLDAGSWKGNQYKGERIPLLKEALSTIPKEKRMFVEIKCGPEAIPPIQQIIEKEKVADRVALIGFGYETLKKAKRTMPEIPVYWVVGWNPKGKNLTKKALDAGFDGLDLNSRLIRERLTNKILEQDLELHAWTINDPEKVLKLQHYGVQSITTDRPGYMRKKLLEFSAQKGGIFHH